MSVYNVVVLIATIVGTAIGLALFAVGCVCWLSGRPMFRRRRRRARRI